MHKKINEKYAIKLAIACALANESQTIKAFITEMLDACNQFEAVKFIAVFDNTDKDGTLEIVKEMSTHDDRISVVIASECNNVVDAILKAYHVAVNTQYDWILEINAGYRHQPEDLAKFVPYMAQGYDCVFGSRFLPTGSMSAPSIMRYIYSKGGTWLANLTLGTSLTDMTSGYLVIKREIAVYLINKKIYSKYHFVNTEMKMYCRKFNTIEVPITYKTKAPNLKLKVLFDAFINLFRLIILRILGRV